MKSKSETKNKQIKTPEKAVACPVFILDGNWGNLCVASEKIGFPFTSHVDATIDNLRNFGKCEIIVKNHTNASGKLLRSLRDNDIESPDVTITLR